jgi:hypothetical protein
MTRGIGILTGVDPFFVSTPKGETMAMTKEEIDERDGWVHLYRESQGELNRLKSELLRLQQTALEASQLDPPFMKCVVERIERSIAILRK